MHVARAEMAVGIGALLDRLPEPAARPRRRAAPSSSASTSGASREIPVVFGDGRGVRLMGDYAQPGLLPPRRRARPALPGDRRRGRATCGTAHRPCCSPRPVASSGEARTAPLIFGRDGDDYLVVASVGGSPEHPAWYLNLAGGPAASRSRCRASTSTSTARTASPRREAAPLADRERGLAELRRVPVADRPGDPRRRAHAPRADR